ncbi:MAG: M48 family metalloprotease [Candidatus Baltobacteraceae bacterium]
MLVFLTGSTNAATNRPNGLDHRITALTNAELLNRPATVLVDPTRQLAAERLSRFKEPVWFFLMLCIIGALAYFWLSGAAAALRDRLRRSIDGEFLVRFCFGALLGLVADLASLPGQFVQYRLLRVEGLSVELSRPWAIDWLVTLVLVMLAVGLIAAIVLWLADRTHQWYLYVLIGIFAVSFGLALVNPFSIGPLYNRTVGLPASQPLAVRLRSLETRAGYPSLPILAIDGSQRSEDGGAFVAGFGPSDRIVLEDSLLAGATDAEIVFATAHELGHVADHDPLHLAIFDAVIFILMAALAVLLADRIRFRRDDDAVSRLALVGALIGCMYVLAIPFVHAYTRHLEAGADAYALRLTHDPAAGVREMVRFADQGMRVVCPDVVSSWYFDTHPSIARRIAAVNHVPDACP